MTRATQGVTVAKAYLHIHTAPAPRGVTAWGIRPAGVPRPTHSRRDLRQPERHWIPTPGYRPGEVEDGT